MHSRVLRSVLLWSGASSYSDPQLDFCDGRNFFNFRVFKGFKVLTPFFFKFSNILFSKGGPQTREDTDVFLFELLIFDPFDAQTTIGR